MPSRRRKPHHKGRALAGAGFGEPQFAPVIILDNASGQSQSQPPPAALGRVDQSERIADACRMHADIDSRRDINRLAKDLVCVGHAPHAVHVGDGAIESRLGQLGAQDGRQRIAMSAGAALFLFALP